MDNMDKYRKYKEKYLQQKAGGVLMWPIRRRRPIHIQIQKEECPADISVTENETVPPSAPGPLLIGPPSTPPSEPSSFGPIPPGIDIGPTNPRVPVPRVERMMNESPEVLEKRCTNFVRLFKDKFSDREPSVVEIDNFIDELRQKGFPLDLINQCLRTLPKPFESVPTIPSRFFGMSEE